MNGEGGSANTSLHYQAGHSHLRGAAHSHRVFSAAQNHPPRARSGGALLHLLLSPIGQGHPQAIDSLAPPGGTHRDCKQVPEGASEKPQALCSRG